MFHRKLTKSDVVAVTIVLALALTMLLTPFLFRSEASVLLVSTPNGNYAYTLSQDRQISISSNGYDLTVVIENGEAYVLESTCHDGVCRASKPISKGGESILCAPAGVRLSVKGGSADVDFVAG